MVESTNKLDEGNLAPNVDAKGLATMTEYERRLARAARYGLDPSKVVGPQAEQQLRPVEAFDRMAQGPKAVAVDRIMQKIDKLKARAERFADEDMEDTSNNAIKNLENRVCQLKSLEKPEEIKKDAAIVEDSLYLYGVDFMSTDNIKEYMGIQFPDLTITWINDSSCTIKFLSAEQAADAYKKFSIRPAVLETSASEEQSFDERNFDSRTGWREALAYHHGKLGWQALWIRFATDLDVKKEETKGENSRFYKYQRKQQERRNPGLRHKTISKPDKKIVDKKEIPARLLGAEDSSESEKESEKDKKSNE